MPHLIAMASATTTQDNGAGQGSGRETQPAPEINESPNAAMVVSPVPFVTPPSPSAPEGEAFPGFLTCSYTKQPPYRAVYLNIPGADGHMSVQVFEYTALYRSISITGFYSQYRNLRHPIIGGERGVGFIDRRRALEVVVDVEPHIQERISRERELLKLPPDEPLVDEDRAKYEETMAKMEDLTRHPNEDGIDEDGTENPGDEMEGLVGEVVVAGNGQRNRESFEERRRQARAAADLFDDSSSDDEAVAPSLPSLRGGAPGLNAGRGIRPRRLASGGVARAGGRLELAGGNHLVSEAGTFVV